MYLLVVVVTSLVGGFYAAPGAAIAGSLLLNYYFAPPMHTLTITDRDNVLALVIFLLIAVLVSRVVDLSAGRSARAARASAEAETLSALAGSVLRGEHALPALLGAGAGDLRHAQREPGASRRSDAWRCWPPSAPTRRPVRPRASHRRDRRRPACWC